MAQPATMLKDVSATEAADARPQRKRRFGLRRKKAESDTEEDAGEPASD